MPEKPTIEEALDTPGGEWRDPNYTPPPKSAPPKTELQEMLSDPLGKKEQLRRESNRAREGHLGRNEKLHEAIMKDK